MSSQVFIRNSRCFKVDVYKVASVDAPLQNFGATDKHANARRQSVKR